MFIIIARSIARFRTEPLLVFLFFKMPQFSFLKIKSKRTVTCHKAKSFRQSLPNYILIPEFMVQYRDMELK